jgi:hypothetical protein
MRSTHMDRMRLIGILKENRGKHRDLFLKAQEGFRARAIEELDKMLECARKGDKVRLHVGLDAPEDHTDDYDRVIGMLEMSVDDNVEVDANSYECFVRDKWAWSLSAMAKNSRYASGGAFWVGENNK